MACSRKWLDNEYADESSCSHTGPLPHVYTYISTLRTSLRSSVAAVCNVAKGASKKKKKKEEEEEKEEPKKNTFFFQARFD